MKSLSVQERHERGGLGIVGTVFFVLGGGGGTDESKAPFI